jgi:hypothetical protein
MTSPQLATSALAEHLIFSDTIDIPKDELHRWPLTPRTGN